VERIKNRKPKRPKKQKREERPLTAHASRLLGVRVDPGFGEVYYKSFRFLRIFESISKTADGMRVPLAIALPRDFSSRTPQLGAFV
jgi:hypothetical protein